VRRACAVACISDISARSRAGPGRTILADTTPRLGCSNVPAVRPRPPGLRRIIVWVLRCDFRAVYEFMFSSQPSARDIPTSATLVSAPACCALCPHIQCACAGTALRCLASTAVRLARCARSTDQCAVLSTVLLDGIPHNFLVLTSFGVNQPLILQSRDSSARC
jgi:hypothetical protein